MKKPRPQGKKTTASRTSPLKTHKIKIRVVGIGGGGASIVSELVSYLRGVSFLVADTDEKVLKKVRQGVRTLQFGESLVAGMGTGMNPELAQRAALSEKEKISRVFKDQDMVVLLGSLGGGVASGAGPVFAEAVRSQPTTAASRSRPPISIGIFTLPFSFEGEKKMKIAKKALSVLQQNLSGVLVVPNEKIFQLVDKKTALKKSLSALNQAFASWLSDLLGVISKPGLINIDFADLRTILASRGMTLFFGQGVAHGPTRAEEVVKNIFQNPFTEGEPKRVRRILFNVSGGRDLGLKEVETISNQIARLNPRAKIIFGISEDGNSQGKIKVILLAVSDTERAGKLERKHSQKSKKAKIVQMRPRLKPLVKKAGPSASKAVQETGDSSQKKRKSKTRRSALEIKKEEKEVQDKEWVQEPEWEIPAFLRKDL